MGQPARNCISKWLSCLSITKQKSRSGFSGKVVIAMNELIRLEGITKKFGEHLIIPTLDLTINDGEFVTLLGTKIPGLRLERHAGRR